MPDELSLLGSLKYGLPISPQIFLSTSSGLTFKPPLIITLSARPIHLNAPSPRNSTISFVTSGVVSVTPFRSITRHPLSSTENTTPGSPYFIGGECDDKWGEHTVLYIEGKEMPDELSLLGSLKKVLKSHEMPRRIVMTDCIPRTENGKIKRGGL